MPLKKNDLRRYRAKVLSWHEDGVLPEEIAKTLGITKTQVELIIIAWKPDEDEGS